VSGDRDIVERLRLLAKTYPQWGEIKTRSNDAADEIERLMDGMELAWGLIANGQYWDRTDGRKYGEWNEARVKWRDEHWHPALSRNKAKPGDRIVDGGRMGTIVTCPTCDGDGILHDPDEKPEPSIPEGGRPS